MRTSLLSLFVLLGALVGCSGSDEAKDMGVDGLKYDSRPRVRKPFGQLCDTPGQKCSIKDPDGYDLICIALENTTGKGYCSRGCTDVGDECYGVPNGQMAGCFVSSGESNDAGPTKKYCGFLCQTPTGAYDCPPDLVCGKANPQGQAVCLPPTPSK